MSRKPTKSRRRRRRMFTQQGIALIAVTLALSGILLLSDQFGTRANVDLMAAVNHRDQMRAHFLARSALNLSNLVIRLQQRIDNIQQLQGIQITDFADLLMTAFGGDAEQVKDVIGLDADQVKGLGADIGTFGVSITTEDDKINVNCANARGQVTDYLVARISALYFLPLYDPIFSEPDADGWRRDRDTQTQAIVDYIDLDNARTGQPGAPEDYGYENLKDPYWPKNNQLDTKAALRLVRGVDDRFWSLFGSAFTVYGGCKTNLSAVTDPKILMSIFILAAKNPQDPILSHPDQLWNLALVVAKAKELGFVFTSVDEFQQFVKDPVGSLTAGLSQASSSGGGTTPSFPGLPAGLTGLELDSNKLAQIASAGPRRIYRVEAWGEVTRGAKVRTKDGAVDVFPPLRRTLTGVWDTQVHPQNARPTLSGLPGNGAWVYLREE
jgi:Type II secretion system (T2SS), protein K